MDSQHSKYFLPYQVRWLKDKSKIKISEKSRRIGMTYVQSYEDVEDCVTKAVPAVWFTSADITAAKEYIQYCKNWAKIFNVAAKFLGELVIDEQKGVKVLVLEFQNGTRINALSSNPSQFRSKGGKIVIDEYAFHKDQAQLWKAARPCITWGFPLRILSTHNGKNCKYFQFVDDVKRGKKNWSLHTTTIFTAVEEGLADKILGRNLTKEERQAWIDEERANAGDEATWLEEYCCEPVDEQTAFLTYDMISTCEMDNILRPLAETEGDLYVGMDVARKKHFSVIWVLEKLGTVKYTRAKIELQKMMFKQQREMLYSILEHPKIRRACIDSTGLGMQLAEEAQTAFGKYRVEAVTFNGSVKEEMAYQLLTAFEDREIKIPYEQALREDLHSVRKLVTTSGSIRFDVEASETDGHADRFWALALANHAASSNKGGPIYIASRRKRHMNSELAGYD